MINTSFMTAIFPNALNKEPNVVLINKKHKIPIALIINLNNLLYAARVRGPVLGHV